MKKIILLITILTTLKSFSQTQNWIYVGSDAEGGKHYFKSEYVSKEENVIKIWAKVLLRTITNKKVIYKNATRLDLMEIDCYSKKVRGIKEVFYSASRKLISTLNNDYSEFEDIIPDSIGEDLVKKICEYFK